MTDLETPYHPTASADADSGGHAQHHHLSPWALFLGFTVPIFAIGIVTNYTVLGIGALLVLIGLIGWIREDYIAFPKGPNPLTHHTQGVRDNGWWGVMLFLATEVVLFGSIFAVFFASRATQLAEGAPWPPVQLPIFETAINTAILVASGFVMMFGEKALVRGSRKGFALGFGGAILLGSVFLYNQVKEYIHLISEGLTLDSSIYGSSFYLLTGTHGAHVFGGIVFLAIILVRGLKGNFSKERHIAMSAAAIYWHFVDIVWIILFGVVYLQWI
jgi:cytochrome c oxidase subunit III